MNTTKLQTFSGFKKSIVVTDWWCGKEGIEIHYDMDGKEMSLLANPEQSCKLLETIGVIETYHFENDTLWVGISIELEGMAKPKTVVVEWEQFLLSYNFSQAEAIDCAAWHEGDKMFHRIAKGGRA